MARPKHTLSCLLPRSSGSGLAARGLFLHHRAVVRRHLPQGSWHRSGYHLPVLCAGRKHTRIVLHWQHSRRAVRGRAVSLVLAVRHRHRLDHGFTVCAGRRPARRPNGHSLCSTGAHRQCSDGCPFGTRRSPDRGHAASLAARSQPRHHELAGVVGRGVASKAARVGSFRCGQGRGRRERSGLDSHPAPGIDRGNGLERPGERRRGRQLLDLGHAGTCLVDAARRGDAHHGHLGRTADFHDRTCARGRRSHSGPLRTTVDSCDPRIGKRGSGRPGGS